MSFFDVINNIMNTISNSLLFPVVFLLVALSFIALIPMYNKQITKQQQMPLERLNKTLL
jgi:hypothetical protein